MSSDGAQDQGNTGTVTLGPHPTGPSDRPWGETALTRHYVTARSRKPRRWAPRGRLAQSAVVIGIAATAAMGATVAFVGSGAPARSAPAADAGAQPPGSGDGQRPATEQPVSSAPEAAGGRGEASPADVPSILPDADAAQALGNTVREQAAEQEMLADDAARWADALAAADRATERRRSVDAARAARNREEVERQEEAEQKEGAESPPGQTGDFVLPVTSYTVTSGFGDKGRLWSSGKHTGLDFAAPSGSPIMAVHSGTVVAVTTQGAYGNRTVLQLADGTEVWFCHQDSVAVKEGQEVRAGEVIGAVGATGNTTGPHLHLEVHALGGKGIDPMTWLTDNGVSV
ncbi:peptidoglycan DD-metalloendopeptidase family protein [Streptomyces sp. NPDC087844]|uniref:M23 family metallopeptidase n=1 Tax=Streptomyces sp. NPDC087844 TaxID=3365805 RepID=UPI0038114619